MPRDGARTGTDPFRENNHDITGIMEEKPQLLWASYYLSALAKALMDDAELGMKR
ncbi:hypothetical protein [Pseudomonas sp. TE50-2]|uniref:hypothetical protein n=1 Tax=Pseudomonas sp. TE50-2 TaxID=3142707 RepID=UPI0034665CA1